jgi:hypothetical protein
VEVFRIHDPAAHGWLPSPTAAPCLVFDTTLRDGEQSPGATLNTQEKLEIAGQLARLGVDIMEAGFPAASPGDLEAVKRIANTVGRRPWREQKRHMGCTAGDRRVGPCQQARHRQGLGSGPGGRAPADPHLPGDQRHPHAAQAAHGRATRCWRLSATWCTMRAASAPTSNSALRMAGAATRLPHPGARRRHPGRRNHLSTSQTPSATRPQKNMVP